jgi:EpsI family protein
VGSAAAFVALAALWPALAALNGSMSAQAQTPRLAQLALPWQQATPFTDWQPDFLNPDARVDRTVAAGDARVALSILYYRNDGSGEPLISSVNRLASGNGHYFELGAGSRQETVAGHSLTLRETTISGPGGDLLAWHWTQVGGQRTASAHVGKALQARERLMLRAGDGAAVIAATPLAHGPDAARAALRAFLEANLAPIDAALGGAEAR